MSDSKKALVVKAFSAIKTSVDAAYFFEHLNSSDWIRPMIELGIFNSPPRIITSGTEVRIPIWPQSRYLIRMAPIDPEAVRDALKSIPLTDNARIHDDMLQAILALPLEYQLEFVPTVRTWLDAPYLFSLPDGIVRLIDEFAIKDQTTSAIDLTRALLAISIEPNLPAEQESDKKYTYREVKSKFEVYQYEHLMNQILPILLEYASGQFLLLLYDFLELLHGLSSVTSSESYWLIKHPSIEESDQTRDHNIEDHLINACRDVGTRMVESGALTLEGLLRLTESRSGILFERLRIHWVRIHGSSNASVIAAYLSNPGFIFSLGCSHEFWHLLHERFGGLTEADKKLILNYISSGPEAKESRPSESLVAGEDEDTLGLWQLRILSAIKSDISLDWQAAYLELVNRFGEHEHPDFHSYMGKLWTGPTSPLSSVEILKLTTNEFLDFVHTWKPSGEWRAETRSGLGRELSQAVSEDPQRFANDALHFIGEAPVIISSLFTGLRQAINGGRSFVWVDLLQLAYWSTQQLEPEVAEDDSVEKDEADWGWARRTIIDLVERGLEPGPSELNFELREDVWRIIEPLTGDSDPTVEADSTRGGSSIDAQSLAINSVRGVALASTIKYGLWVYRHLYEEHSETDRPNLDFSVMPEVRYVLDAHLRIDQDPSLAIRTVYGRYLPWLQLLDPNWIAQKLSQVFPPDPELMAYWNATWDSYVSSCSVFDNVFYLIEPEYRRAVASLKTSLDLDVHPHGHGARLAEHLMVLFWRGVVELGEGFLLDLFFELANDELRAWAMTFLGRSLIEEADGDDAPVPRKLPTELSLRLVRLWESRMTAAAKNDVSSEFRAELSSFGWWYSSGAFDAKWRLQQLIESLRMAKRIDRSHAVLKRLELDSTDHPNLVIRALRLMILWDKTGWSVPNWQSEITNILSSVLGSGDGMARLEALDVIEALGARGFNQYRKFLPAK